MTPDKPFAELNEQLTILKSRNLIIPNNLVAYKKLLSVGYYSLINGYSKPYMSEDNYYVEGTKFDQIIAQYELDEYLKETVFQRIIHCEKRLKTILSYYISKEYGVWDTDNDQAISYLSESNYDNTNKKRKEILSKISKTKKTTNSNPTKYYRQNKNHIPPWILFDNCSMWEVNSLYRVLKSELKIKVAHELFPFHPLFNKETTLKIIADSYELLREFRNCAAHGSRFYAFKSKASIPFIMIENLLGPKIVSSKEYNDGIGRKDLFALLLTITIFNPDINDTMIMVTDIIRIQEKMEFHKTDPNIFPFKEFIEISKLPSDFGKRIISGIQFMTDLIEPK